MARDVYKRQVLYTVKQNLKKIVAETLESGRAEEFGSQLAELDINNDD